MTNFLRVCEKKQRCFHTRCRVRCTRKRKNDMKKGCFQNYGNNLLPSIIFRAVPVQENGMKWAQTSVWRAVRCKKHKNLYVKNRNRNVFLVAVIFCCFALSAFTIALYTHCFFQMFFLLLFFNIMFLHKLSHRCKRAKERSCSFLRRILFNFYFKPDCLCAFTCIIVHCVPGLHSLRS